MFLHPLHRGVEFLHIGDGDIELLILIQRIVGIPGGLHHPPVRSGQFVYRGDLGQQILDVVNLGVELDCFFRRCQFVQIGNLGLGFRVEGIIGVPSQFHRFCLRLIAGVGDGGDGVDKLNDAFRAVAVHDLDGVPGAGILDGFRFLVVHGQPCRLTYADVDDIAGLDRDRLAPAVEIYISFNNFFIQESFDLIVFVRSSGCYRYAAAVGDQDVFQDISVKTRGQCSAIYLKIRQAGITARPGAAQIRAIALQREHDADFIAVYNSVIPLLGRSAERGEAFIGKPVVEDSHPAGCVLPVKLFQLVVTIGNCGDVGDAGIIHAALASARAFPSVTLAS